MGRCSYYQGRFSIAAFVFFFFLTDAWAISIYPSRFVVHQDNSGQKLKLFQEHSLQVVEWSARASYSIPEESSTLHSHSEPLQLVAVCPYAFEFGSAFLQNNSGWIVRVDKEFKANWIQVKVYFLDGVATEELTRLFDFGYVIGFVSSRPICGREVDPLNFPGFIEKVPVFMHLLEDEFLPPTDLNTGS